MRRLPVVAFIAVAVAAIGSQFFPQPAPARSVTRWVSPRTQLAAIFSYPQYAMCDPNSGNCASISSNGQIATTGGGGGGGSSTVYNGTGSQTLVASSFLGDGGTYNATQQTFTSGQYSPFQTDVNGYLDVDVKVGGGGSSGSTPIPFATNAQGQLVVQAASPYPTPNAVQSVTGAVTVNTAAPYVAPTCAAAPNAPCVQITGSVVVNTAAPVTSVTANAGTGTFQVAAATTLPVSLATLPPLAAGTATIGSIGNTAFGITGSLPSGTNAIGSVTVSNTVNTNPTFPYSLAVTTGQTGTASSALGVVGQYYSGTLALTSGQVTPLQVDAAGNLKVNVAAGGGSGGGGTTVVTNTAASPVPVALVSALPAGSNTIGTVNAGTGFPTPLAVQPVSATTALPEPYAATAGQTSGSASFIGIAASNGTTTDALRDGPAGTAISPGTAGVAYTQGTGLFGATPITLLGSSSLATNQVSVAATATLIVAARTGVSGTGRYNVTLYNPTGGTTVYVGNSGVTTTTGLPVVSGASLTLQTQAALYGISASGSNTVAYDELY